MVNWFCRRYLEILGSIYLYNEHRGYTALDRVIEAVRAGRPRTGILSQRWKSTAPMSAGIMRCFAAGSCGAG
jgi:hypothetical protein